MAKVELSLLRSKFRGSMLGVLVGDCLGSPYEFDETLSSGSNLVLQRSLDQLEAGSVKAPLMQYTDDSAMSKCVAESLIQKKELDLVDIAKRFVASYYKEPNRGYGPGVVTVFKKLRGNKFTNVFAPAQEQFDGLGSYGNGGAMRITPIALFCYDNYEKLLDLAKSETELTHTHRVGVDGAILQAAAVQQSLLLNPNDELNISDFVDKLIDKMEKIEVIDEGFCDEQPYKIQLNVVKNLVAESETPQIERVVKELGADVSALHSVPTAIFCFLLAQKPINGIQTDNPFRRAIQFAISLGGDTDTIGSMTGAIAGAFYGEDKIHPSFLQHIEASEEFRQLGDDLYEVAVSAEKSK